RQVHWEEVMKPRYTMGLTLLTGIAIGALAVQGLHAQSKPPIYVVAEIDVSNQDAYVKEYAPLARAAIKAGGGKLIAVSSNVTSIEGTPQKSRVAIQEWESMEKFKAYRASAALTDARKVGDKYAKFRSYVVEGFSQ